jgi:predicted Fe-Mo cluster-binding NifX family protein
MRVCVPVDSKEGLKSPLSNQFEAANYYLLVDADTRAFETIANNGAQREPLAALSGHYIQAVIANQIGNLTLSKLADRKIEIIHSTEDTAENALNSLSCQHGAAR